MVLLTLPWSYRILEPEAPLQRRIEVIGASVSNGFGNRGHHEGVMGAPSTQTLPSPDVSDPSQAFGPLLGRALQADTRIIAYEGSSILGAALPGVPRTAELWHQAVAGQDHPQHDPSSWVPQVLLQQSGTPMRHADMNACACVWPQSGLEMLAGSLAQQAQLRLQVHC